MITFIQLIGAFLIGKFMGKYVARNQINPYIGLFGVVVFVIFFTMLVERLANV